MIIEFNLFLIIWILLFLIITLILFKTVKSTVIRGFTTFVFLVGVVTCFYGYVELLSNPKDVKFEFFKDADEAEVVYSQIVPSGDTAGIYLLLKFKNSDSNSSQFYNKPYYYVMEYNEKIAQKLQNAINRRRKEGGKVIIPNPFNFDKSWEERESPFYNLPPTRTPPKNQEQDDGVQEFSEPLGLGI